MAVSVIVPASERPAPLADLYRDFSAPLRELGLVFEFVFVVEPQFSDLTAPLNELIVNGEPIRVYEAGRTVGETTLLQLGAARSAGRVIITLPPYYRVQPEAIPELIRRVEQGADLVLARRWPRHDSWINRAQSRLLHRLIGALTERKVSDVACGVRALRREVIQEVPLYGDMLRFLPLFALQKGYQVEEVSSPQHPRDTGPRIYHPFTYLRRLIDVLGLFFLLRFTHKPLRFFGLLGTLLSGVGGVILAVVLWQKYAGRALSDRPLLLLGVLLVVLGAQAFALGLIGELLIYLRPRRYALYRLRDE